MESSENINNSNWYYKNLFEWTLIHYNREHTREIYRGKKKDNSKFTVIIKKIEIDNNYHQILKEIYYLGCYRKCEYFIKLVDLFLSEDKKFIFLILKDEGVSLRNFIICPGIINNKGHNYNEYKDTIKWIVFQIVCGLFILHKNNLVHNDIKPDNILISSVGKVTIGDFGSIDKANTKGLGTFYYKSPDILLGKESTEKDDMWGVGVIMVELYKKKFPFFNFNEFSEQNNVKKCEKLFQLKSILSKYKICINNNIINTSGTNNFYFIKNHVLKANCYNNFQAELNLNNIEEIEDIKALELINNLLNLNPGKRFDAKQALDSKYLSNYKNAFQQYTISNENEDLIINVANENIFLKNVEIMKEKFIGKVIYG